MSWVCFFCFGGFFFFRRSIVPQQSGKMAMISETSACSSLKRLSSLPEMDVKSSVTTPWPALQKIIPTKKASGETSKAFVRGKNNVDEHTSGLRESLSCTLLAVLITFMGHFFLFPLANHFYLPVLQPCVQAHFLAKWSLVKRLLGS